MKQAKISISADIGSLKKAVDQAKKTVEGLTKIKLTPQAAEGFKKLFGEQLDRQIKQAETKLNGLNKRLEQVGKGSIMDPKRLEESIAGVEKLTGAVKELKKQKQEVAKIGLGAKAEESEGAGGGGVLGSISTMAKSLGLAIGAMAIYTKRVQMAKERIGIRELGGSSTTATERSRLGFTPEERRARMLETQRAVGRNLSAADLGNLTDVSEKVQRAYGIQGGETANAMTVARKNLGSGTETKYLSQTIGAAVAAKLEGSRIGEFLQESSAALEEMSHNGITVDSESLNGFAAALSTLPFFKSDPSKAFDQIKGLNDAFQKGDRFQQAQAARAIQGAAGGGVGPAAIEQRRTMGLFATLRPETMQMLSGIGAKGTMRAFRGGPGGVLSNLVKNAVGATKGMSPDNQLYEVMQRLGLKGEGGMEIAAKAIKSGGNLAKAGLSEKDFQKATMSPEDKLQTTMDSIDGRVLDLDSTVQQSIEQGVEDLSDAVFSIGKDIVDAINKLSGGHAADIGGAAIGLGTAAVGAYTIKSILKKFGVGAGEAAEGAAGAEGAAAVEGGAAAAGGMGVGGMLLGGAAVGAAGLAGYGAGKYIANPLLDKYTTQTNRYGQKSNMAERGIARLSNMLPSWMPGSTSDDEFNSMYGTGEDKMMANLTGDQAIAKAREKIAKNPNLDANTGGVAGLSDSSDDNTEATSENTMAIRQLTQVISTTSRGGRPGRVGKGVGVH